MPESDTQRRELVEPFRLLLALVSVIYSVAALYAFDRYGSPALKAIPDRTWALVYLAWLLIAGSVTAWGTIRRYPKMEGAGLLALAFIWGSFSALGWLNSGDRAAAFSSFLAAFAVAALWAWAQNLIYDWWRAHRGTRGAAQ